MAKQNGRHEAGRSGGAAGTAQTSPSWPAASWVSCPSRSAGRCWTSMGPQRREQAPRSTLPERRRSNCRCRWPFRASAAAPARIHHRLRHPQPPGLSSRRLRPRSGSSIRRLRWTRPCIRWNRTAPPSKARQSCRPTTKDGYWLTPFGVPGTARTTPPTSSATAGKARTPRSTTSAPRRQWATNSTSSRPPEPSATAWTA